MRSLNVLAEESYKKGEELAGYKKFDLVDKRMEPI